MAYTLGNKCAKNLCKWTVLLQLIIENVVTCFFLEHSVQALGSWAARDTAEKKFLKNESDHGLSQNCLRGGGKW